MKLSEAILKGCELAPHRLEGRMLGLCGTPDKLEWKACALGAAFLAWHGADLEYEELAKDDYITSFLREHGCTNVLMTEVVFWNDDEHLSREEIAARVADLGY